MKLIIEAIEAKLQAQKDDIFFKDLQIQDLKEQLAAAEKEIAELKQAIEESKTSIKINLSRSSITQRSAAIQFQRSFDDMDDETAKEILEIIARNKKSGL